MRSVLPTRNVRRIDRLSRFFLIAAALAVSLALVLPAGATDSGNRDDEDNFKDLPCRPGVTSPGKTKGKGNSGHPADYPDAVTTLCVGKHPTDVAISNPLNLAVVADRDSSRLSLIDLAAATLVGTVPLEARPLRLAVDGTLAAVVSPWNPAVFLVNLGAPGLPVTRIPLQDAGIDVALDADAGLVVVLHRFRNFLTVVSLAQPSNPAATIRLPERADQLGYAKGSRRALLTTGAFGGSLMVVDVDADIPALTLRHTVPLKPSEARRKGPFDPAGIDVSGPASSEKALIVDKAGAVVVYDVSQNLAYPPFDVVKGRMRDVAGYLGGSLAVLAGHNDDAFIVDVDAGQALYRVPVRQKPAAVAVGGSGCTVAVANYSEDSVSLFALAPDCGLVPPPPPPPQAAPTIRRITPDSTLLGDPNPVTIEIQGTGFTPAATVALVGSTGALLAPVSVAYVSATRLLATVPTSLADYYAVTVAVGNRMSNALTFTVRNPPPVVSPPLRPSNVVAGSVTFGTLAVWIDGGGFIPATTLLFDGHLVESARFSATQLRMDIPADLLQTPRTVTVAVSNPPPGGGIVSVPFEVESPLVPTGVTVASVRTSQPTLGAAVDPSGDLAMVTHLISTPSGALGNAVTLLDNLRTPDLAQNPPGVVQTITLNPAGPAAAPALAATHPGYRFEASSTPVPAAVFTRMGDKKLSVLELCTSCPTPGVPRLATSGDLALLNPPEGVAVFRPGGNTNGYAAITTPYTYAPGTLSVVELDTLQPLGLPIVLGMPRSVAIHPTTHLAVVPDAFNYPKGDAILFDLSIPASPLEVARIRVGEFPVRVAVDSVRNLAVVTNEVSPDVSIIDLAARRLRATVRIGVEPYGVAIDETRGVAFIATRIDAKLRVVDLKPQTPRYLGELSTSLPFIPTEIAVIPGTTAPDGSPSVRLLVTDVGGTADAQGGTVSYVTVVDIPSSLLP